MKPQPSSLEVNKLIFIANCGIIQAKEGVLFNCKMRWELKRFPHTWDGDVFGMVIS